ncbi:hypothetical protein DL96DRAFT_1699457 [Flagelloscypha sp. PMI_526]|nr:hypothetical protein DL96DRAFT_1699457 [Flagelloscypha sp. PMI_526]
MKARVRDEALALLHSLGVILPPKTKLPLEALLRRIRQCLDAAQETKLYIHTSSINPGVLPAWTTHSGENSLQERMYRFSYKEASQNHTARLLGKESYKELYEDPFQDLRMTLQQIAIKVDAGHHAFIVQDSDKEHCGINMRVISTHHIESTTPLLVVIYLPGTKLNPLPGLRWIQNLMKHPSYNGIANITGTFLEQKLLLRLLALNEKYLDATFKTLVKSQVDANTEQSFHVSFLLPLNTIGSEDLGKLNAEIGCEICGKNTASRCSQCQTLKYCGPECQKLDWPHHRTICRSLKGGKWLTLPLKLVPSSVTEMKSKSKDAVFTPSVDDAIRAGQRPNFNPSDYIYPVTSEELSVPPPNIHGEKPFIVKIQVSLASIVATDLNKGKRNMMVYDRQRSFQLYFDDRSSKDEGGAGEVSVFDQVLSEMKRNGVTGGLKMYRYAKRTGDWEITLCIDRGPDGEVAW